MRLKLCTIDCLQAHTVLEMNYTEQQLSAAVSSGELRPTLAGPEVGAPPSLSSLIEQCWSNTPADRPSFDNIVERLSYIPDELSQAVEEDCARTVAEGSAAQVRFLNTESHFDWSASAAGQGSGAREYTAPVWFRQSGCEYCPTLSAGVFATQGGRATMEDTNFLMTRFKGDDHVHLFGVFDGHRGKWVGFGKYRRLRPISWFLISAPTFQVLKLLSLLLQPFPSTCRQPQQLPGMEQPSQRFGLESSY